MVISARRFSKRGGPGFTLLELLLTVALLMGLLAAVVFNFGPLQKGANLDEGGRQFEALIHFASAQAANSGRTVQFRFNEAASNNSTNETESVPALRVVREVDPAGQPGVFEDLPEAQPMLKELLERIQVLEAKGAERPMNQGTNEVAADQAAAPTNPPVTFYPDGSSDTADFLLTSRDPEDNRQLTIHLAGVTGTITSKVRVIDELAADSSTEEKNAGQESTETRTEDRARPQFADEPEKAPQGTTSTNRFSNEDWP